MLTRACLKKSFCKMCVTVCGRFCLNEGGVAGYDDRKKAKSPAKWGMQIAGMIFQTGSRANSSQSGLFRTTHTSSPSPPIPAKQSNQFQTTNYTSPPSANAPDTKTPAFHKTLGTRVSAPGLRGFLRYTLHTEGNTARYWSDKTEDEDCFSLLETSLYWYRRSSPIHTVPSEILLLNIPGKTPHERYFVQTASGPPAYKPSADLFSVC